jgi:hypothetical protein
VKRLGYLLRFLWLKLRSPHVVTRGMVYLDRGAEVFCRRGLGSLELGRGVWIGRRTAIRCHEGHLRIGDGTVFGVGDVVNCYLDVWIGEEVLFADRVHVTDFDHRFDGPGPVMPQGIVKSPVRVGSGSWLGEKATVLRGSRLGEGCVVGAAAVVRGGFPDGAVVVGNPARVVKRRPG